MFPLYPSIPNSFVQSVGLNECVENIKDSYNILTIYPNKQLKCIISSKACSRKYMCIGIMHGLPGDLVVKNQLAMQEMWVQLHRLSERNVSFQYSCLGNAE